MKFCSHCGKEIMDEAVVCVNCGCPVAGAAPSAPTSPAVADEVSIGLCILAALIPLFGIIYWPVKHRETPKRAKACGITAIVAWAISFVLSMIMSASLASMFY